MHPLASLTDALEPMQKGVGIHKAGNEKDDDIDDLRLRVTWNSSPNQSRHQRRCYAEGGGGSGQQGKYRQQVDDPPGRPSVCLPRMGRQASEYFWRLRLRTWSINPKATASTR